MADVRALLREYLDSLGIDLSFQQAEAELASLPGQYAAPRGAILLSRDTQARATGCVALRPGAAARDCEMKRLYVRPAARGEDLGRQLIVQLVAHAAARGYARVLLDTLATMQPAQRLYESLGFRQIGAYYQNPVPGTVYLALDLTGAANVRI